MKICFKWQGFVEKEDVIDIIQKHCWFLPLEMLKWRQSDLRGPNAINALAKREEYMRAASGTARWFAISEVEDFVETYIYGSFASRNVIDGMPTWDIPDDEIANVVSLFCAAGADVSLSEELLTIKC
jgi:hypothetical protein